MSSDEEKLTQIMAQFAEQEELITQLEKMARNVGERNIAIPTTILSEIASATEPKPMDALPTSLWAAIRA